MAVFIVRATVAATGDQCRVSLVPLHSRVLLNRNLGLRQLQIRQGHPHLHSGRHAHAALVALRSRLLLDGRTTHARIQSLEVDIGKYSKLKATNSSKWLQRKTLLLASIWEPLIPVLASLNMAKLRFWPMTKETEQHLHM